MAKPHIVAKLSSLVWLAPSYSVALDKDSMLSWVLSLLLKKIVDACCLYSSGFAKIMRLTKKKVWLGMTVLPEVMLSLICWELSLPCKIMKEISGFLFSHLYKNKSKTTTFPSMSYFTDV